MITLAIIGVGNWGKNILSTLATLPHVKVGYLCDPNRSLSATLTNAKIVGHWKELLESGLDGVVIATPPSTHASIAIPFIKKGVAVFVEKPMTEGLSDAKKLFEASKKAKAPVMVGHIHLFNPAYIALKKIVRELGGIRLIRTSAGNYGPFRDDFSALWDWAPHDVALVLDLLEAMPKTVSAWGDCIYRSKTDLYETAQLRMTFSNGVAATIRVSSLDPIKNREVTVLAGQGLVRFDDIADKKVALYKNFAPDFRKKGNLNPREAEIIYPRVSPEKPLEEELRVFIDAIHNKTEPVSNAELGYKVVRILDAADRSIAQKGKEISLL
ncbi:MAG: Gfo/Idh/MocA family oxidoreductase [Candidatus Taylorbacteria bacterium]|nr:Gfo/Idh/MocA family oxidoreductase [Candidatus Taylorbacteria bacterium]